MADITITDNTEAHRFEVSLEGEVAFAEYRLHAGVIELPHTVVPPAFEGKGVASALTRHAFGYAREKGLKVNPTCSFMAGWVKKHPEEQGLLEDAAKRSLGLA